jgi:tetratricopeptide (TPR) repeat protein
MRLRCIGPALVLVAGALANARSDVSSSQPCAATREYDAAQSQTVSAQLTWSLMMQGVVQYDSPDRRPVPKVSLVDLAERLNRLGDSRNSSMSLRFVFNRRGFGSQLPQVLQATPAVLWCLTMPGDVVLLSDKVTHHVTEIYQLDREQGLVDLVDAWPEAIFLRRGKNAAGVDAQLVDSPSGTRKLVRITRAEFLKVLVGTMMFDGVDLPEQYLALDSAAGAQAKTHLGIAATFLSYPSDLFVADAIGYLERAVAIAERASDRALRDAAASKLHLAYRVALYGSVAGGPAGDPVPREKLERLELRYEVSALEARYSGMDFYRLGVAAGRATRLTEAVELLSRSIAKQPDHQDSYLARAAAFTVLRDRASALRDARHALALNAAEEKALERRIATRGPAGITERESDDASRSTLESQRRKLMRLIKDNS